MQLILFTFIIVVYCYFVIYRKCIFYKTQMYSCIVVSVVSMEDGSVTAESCIVVLFVNVSLCDNADLKILELTHNQIHTLPDDIGDLRHLESLCLRHNKITNLPSFDNCTSLKVSIVFISQSVFI